MIKPISEKGGNLIEVDLTGPDGNVYVLLGLAEGLAKKMGLNPDEIKDEMKAGGDYEKVIEVFENYFGGLVILYR